MQIVLSDDWVNCFGTPHSYVHNEILQICHQGQDMKILQHTLRGSSWCGSWVARLWCLRSQDQYLAGLLQVSSGLIWVPFTNSEFNWFASNLQVELRIPLSPWFIKIGQNEPIKKGALGFCFLIHVPYSVCLIVAIGTDLLLSTWLHCLMQTVKCSVLCFLCRALYKY